MARTFLSSWRDRDTKEIPHRQCHCLWLRFVLVCGGPARTARRQAIHPGWNKASNRSKPTLARSSKYMILSYRISTPIGEFGT
jgi:hypothetical protein